MPNVDYGGLPCVEPIGLRPIAFDIGTSSKENLLIYIKDGECQPLTNEFNAYTYTVKVPGNVAMTYYNTIYTLRFEPPPHPTLFSRDGVALADVVIVAHAVSALRHRYPVDFPTFFFLTNFFLFVFRHCREIEFHTPSEHSFNGVKGVMEVQFKMDKTGCVTQGNGYCVTPNNNDNTKLHLAILFEQGETTPEFVGSYLVPLICVLAGWMLTRILSIDSCTNNT
jgi:hypothetical protein